MSTFSADVRRSTLDILWSLWAECGVSGWHRGAGKTAIDIEALILCTAAVGDLDARLRDEATDWCIRYGDLVSKVRLKNIRTLGLGARGFDEFAATVNAHSALRWPTTRSRARTYTPTGRSELDLRRPSMIGLRARALFGVSARAEIVTLFAIAGGERTATQLAARTCFGRRIIAETADLLVRAGVLGSSEHSNPRTYSLVRGDEMRALLDPAPERAPVWPHLLRVVAEILDIAERAEGQSMVVRAVETQRRLVSIAGSVFAAGLPHVPTLDDTPAGWARFAAWATDVFMRAAG